MTDDQKPRTLKEQLAAEITNDERTAADDPERFKGFDWWQASPEELSVFDIDLERLPRMAATWACYEAFKLIADDPTYYDDLIRHARQEHPEWCDEGISLSEFSAFAKEYAGLTFRESDAFFYKNRYWCIRTGITNFRDEVQQDNEP